MESPSEIQGHSCTSPSPDGISNAVQSVVPSLHEVIDICVDTASDDESVDCKTTELLETIAQFRNLRVSLLQHHQRQSPSPRALVDNDSDVVVVDFRAHDHLTHDDHLCLARINHVGVREKRTRVKKQQSDF